MKRKVRLKGRCRLVMVSKPRDTCFKSFFYILKSQFLLPLQSCSEKKVKCLSSSISQKKDTVIKDGVGVAGVQETCLKTFSCNA